MPQQSWNIATEVDTIFTGGDTLLARVFYEDIDDLVAQIPIGIDGDAVGNIDTANAYGLEIQSTIFGERFGLNGTQLTFEYAAQETSVTDAVTGKTARIGDRRNRYIDVQFRHDIPGTDWAYGFGGDRETDEPKRDTDDISLSYSTGPFTTIFAEHKDVYGMTANVAIRNILGVRDAVRRTVYEGRRDSDIIDFSRRRERVYGRIIRFTLSGSF